MTQEIEHTMKNWHRPLVEPSAEGSGAASLTRIILTLANGGH